MTHCVPKIFGQDSELSNSLLTPGDLDRRSDCADQAARLLLREMPGYPQHPERGTQIESERRFLPTNSMSAYVDLGHCEINLPELADAFAQPRYLHAALRRVREAQVTAGDKLPEGVHLSVLANCSDGGRVSYGSHVSVLVHRDCFEAILHRKPHYAGCLATHLVTSVPYTGQGQMGAGNGRSPCDYQLSQRADWFERFSSLETTRARGLINHRDEPLCTGRDDLARLHIIYFDMTLSPISNILKIGTTQLVLAMLESGWIDPNLQLDDPLASAWPISRDLTLGLRLPMAVRGVSLTAVEVQQALCRLAGEFVASGAADACVPQAARIVSLWRETLDCLQARELEALARRCDNWLKYLLLDRMRGRRGLAWQSNELRVLDLLFASLDPDEGLYWQMAQSGFVSHVPTAAEIEHAYTEPPEDTRAYLRAHVLRRFGRYVSRIDWDQIQFRVPTGRHWSANATMWMPDPIAFGRRECESLLSGCASLNELVEAVNAYAESSSVSKADAVADGHAEDSAPALMNTSSQGHFLE